MLTLCLCVHDVFVSDVIRFVRDFVVYTTGCFVLSFALFFVLVCFQLCLALRSPHLGMTELV